MEERFNRRSNVVFFVVDEADSVSDVQAQIRHDSEIFESLLRKMKITDDVLSFKIRRIGILSPNKTRLMHVKCEDVDT